MIWTFDQVEHSNDYFVLGAIQSMAFSEALMKEQKELSSVSLSRDILGTVKSGTGASALKELRFWFLKM